MRGKNWIILLFFFWVLFLVSCSNYRAPNCEDKQVLSLAKKAFLDSIKKNQIVEQECAKTLMLQGKIAFWRIPSIEEIKQAINKGEAKEEKWLIDFAKCYDLIFTKLQNIKLYAIRVEDRNDKIKKSICKAQLQIDGEDFGTLTYTAQYTKDNHLLVEALWER